VGAGGGGGGSGRGRAAAGRRDAEVREAVRGAAPCRLGGGALLRVSGARSVRSSPTRRGGARERGCVCAG
jgi:hypothetical protein